MGVELREMFEEEVRDELGHASFLTDEIIHQGSEPTTTPRQFPKPEGPKDMIELDLEMEKQDIENYQKHTQTAEELGLVELKFKLEEMAADEAGYAQELCHIFRGPLCYRCSCQPKIRQTRGQDLYLPCPQHLAYLVRKPFAIQAMTGPQYDRISNN